VKTRIDNQSLGYLAQCTSLEHLVLPGSTEDSGLEQVAAIPHLATLQLTGGGTPVLSDRGMIAIGRISTLKKFMAVTGKEVTDAGFAAFAGLNRLESLWLLCNSRKPSDGGLAGLSELKNLVDLNITVPDGSAMTLTGMGALTRLTSLRKLELSGFNRGEGQIDLSPFTQLEMLRLGAVDGMRDGDLAGLAGMSSLRTLGIAGGSDESLAPIAGLKALEQVSISSEALTDNGLRHLSNLQALAVLSIDGDFTEAGLSYLAPLQNLKWLTIHSATPLDDRFVAQLARSMPNLQSFNQQRAFGGAG
jgi:hypothetical protein